MAENEVDLMLELIDYDKQIEIEDERWDENEVECEEEEISEEWEDVPVDIPVVIERENDKITVVADAAAPSKKDGKEPKAKRAKRAPLPKKFKCGNCSKQYALEYHFKRHMDICKKNTQKAKQKGTLLIKRCFFITIVN